MSYCFFSGSRHWLTKMSLAARTHTLHQMNCDINVLVFMRLFPFVERAIYFKGCLKITRDPSSKKTPALTLNDTGVPSGDTLRLRNDTDEKNTYRGEEWTALLFFFTCVASPQQTVANQATGFFFFFSPASWGNFLSIKQKLPVQLWAIPDKRWPL